MCLINFAIQAHPSYPLLIAANRDEFLNRKTAEADYWAEYPFMLGGKDLEKGGMWLGITKKGRFAALTNYREIVKLPNDIRSRGEIIKDFLISDVHALDYLKDLEKKKDEYPGFNLIIGEINELYAYSNRSIGIEKLKPGFYSLCNGDFFCEWPKVEKGKEMMKEAMKIESQKDLETFLFKGLQNSTIAPDSLLPDTGVGKDIERFLSSMYIKGDDYGTRSSTVIIANDRDEIYFTEKTYLDVGDEKDRSYLIKIS